MASDDHPRDDRVSPSASHVETLAHMRSSVLDLDAEAVARQLPHLAEQLAERAADDVSTLQFVVGVSSSRNQTLLDYRLDRWVETDDGVRREVLKPPVSEQHRYVTFPYPPDPTLDEPALRGALLAAIERELAVRGWPEDEAGRAEDEGDEARASWFEELRRQLRLPT